MLDETLNRRRELRNLPPLTVERIALLAYCYAVCLFSLVYGVRRFFGWIDYSDSGYVVVLCGLIWAAHAAVIAWPWLVRSITRGVAQKS
jgi:hypothetical protein